MTEGESGFVERGLLIALYFLAMHMFFVHLGPIDINGSCKDVRVQLRIFHLAIMLSESFGWQGFRFAFAAFLVYCVTTPQALLFKKMRGATDQISDFRTDK